MSGLADDLLQLSDVLFSLFSKELEFKGFDLLGFCDTTKVHLSEAKQKAEVVAALQCELSAVFLNKACNYCL